MLVSTLIAYELLGGGGFTTHELQVVTYHLTAQWKHTTAPSTGETLNCRVTTNPISQYSNSRVD